ncbi:MAG TPA: tetratricopeptide repeat protein, partial [Bryobacteraceae bacterium]
SAQAEAAREKGAPDAPALYQRALQMKPDWKDGWWALGGIYYQKDQFAECAAAFEKLAALDHSAPSHAMAGLCQFGLKNYDAATANLAKAQKLGVMNEGIGQPSMYTLAKLWTKRGNFEGALSILFDFAQLGKENPAYIELAGTAGLWKPMFPEEVPAEDREVVFLAGKAFWAAAKRNVPVARANFADLLEHYPKAPGVHYLAGSFEMFDSSDRAVEMFEDELKINPDHVGALMALGSEYLRQGNTAKALPYARKSVELAPQTYATHTLLGRVLVESGSLEPALKELELARQLQPDDPQPRIALASLYTKLGRKDDAARERREFLRIQASNKKPSER